MGFAEANNILRKEQHGFRSCECQLLGLADELSYNMEKGKQSDVLVMDFSKAYDKVCHSLLIHKLQHYGITGQVHERIKNFLANRQKAVVVDRASSEAVPVEDGFSASTIAVFDTLFRAGFSASRVLAVIDTLFRGWKLAETGGATCRQVPEQ
ncbi:uncharacterized protein LOC143300801 [Babylonia areolata]|uniref:uncharacterized protein LOC143300801 n=1 Tax=Babylonia areolata TaxID=304850 RepID=UPI003FD2DBA3